MVCGMPYAEAEEIWNQSQALSQTSCVISSTSLEPRSFMLAVLVLAGIELIFFIGASMGYVLDLC